MNKLGTTPQQVYGKPVTGKFDATKSYNQFDRVEWQGAIYGCRQDGTQGSDGEPQDNPNAWELIYGYRFTGDGVTSTAYNHIEIAGGGGGGGYTLPVATDTVLGGVKIGDNLTITDDGVLSATGGGGAGYTLPVATTSTLGGIKVGSNLSITSDGVLNPNSAGIGKEGTIKLSTSSFGLFYIDDDGNLAAEFNAGDAIYLSRSAGHRGLTISASTIGENKLGVAKLDTQSGLMEYFGALRVCVADNTGLTVSGNDSTGVLKNTYKLVPKLTTTYLGTEPSITQNETHGYYNERYDNLTLSLPIPNWVKQLPDDFKDLNSLNSGASGSLGTFMFTPSECTHVPDDIAGYTGTCMIETYIIGEHPPYGTMTHYNKLWQRIIVWDGEKATSGRVYIRQYAGSTSAYWTTWKLVGTGDQLSATETGVQTGLVTFLNGKGGLTLGSATVNDNGTTKTYSNVLTTNLPQLLDTYDGATLHTSHRPKITAGENSGIMTIKGNVTSNEYGPLPGTFAIVLTDSLGLNTGDEFAQVVSSDNTSEAWDGWDGYAVTLLLQKLDDNSVTECNIGFTYADGVTSGKLASSDSVTLTAGTYIVHIG